MGGKSVGFEYEGATPARVWAAALDAVGVLGYSVTHSDKGSRTLSFNTGRSMSSWAGQDLSMILAESDTGTRMSMGGSLGKGGNPFAGGQAFAWGEKGRLINKFAETVAQILPTIPEKTPKAKAAPAVSVADEIAKLAALRDSGALTADEFDAQKAKLLG
jgi:hypothetical protein